MPEEYSYERRGGLRGSDISRPDVELMLCHDITGEKSLETLDPYTGQKAVLSLVKRFPHCPTWPDNCFISRQVTILGFVARTIYFVSVQPAKNSNLPQISYKRLLAEKFL